MITRGKTRNMDAVLKTLNEIKEDLKGKATQEQINTFGGNSGERCTYQTVRRSASFHGKYRPKT